MERQCLALETANILAATKDKLLLDSVMRRILQAASEDRLLILEEEELSDETIQRSKNMSMAESIAGGNDNSKMLMPGDIVKTIMPRSHAIGSYGKVVTSYADELTAPNICIQFSDMEDDTECYNADEVVLIKD